MNRPSYEDHPYRSFRHWLRRRAVFLYGWLCTLAGWIIAGLIAQLGDFGASTVLGVVALTVLTLVVARVADWLEVRVRDE